MSFSFFKDNTKLFTFNQEEFPSFCGGKILHNFCFTSEFYALSETDKKEVAEAFKQCVESRGWRCPTGYHLNYTLSSVAFFTLAAVKGSPLAKVLSVRGYRKTRWEINPNSDNLTSVYTIATKE